jgi:hypothetical protein
MHPDGRIVEVCDQDKRFHGFETSDEQLCWYGFDGVNTWRKCQPVVIVGLVAQ